jgi:arylsulfatase A-like enzyme
MTAQLHRTQSEFNLVIFLPDQQRADTLACYGNPKVHAVNLNKLAAESVVFERAYVTQPVCSPSRASLMTGLWPHMTGCTNNGFTLDGRLATLPELIGDGYRTGYVGKWHLRDEPPTKRGFHDWVSVEGVSDYSKFLIKKGLVPDHEKGGFSALTVSNLPLELSRPKFVEHHACEFIRRTKKRRFILVVAFVEPHSPYNGPFNDEHALSEIDVDPTASMSPSNEHLPLRYRLFREWEIDEATQDKSGSVRQSRFGVTLDDYRRLKQKYLGLITLVDQSIGAILACLDQNGLADRTIIAHTSDHGDLLGAHGIFGKGVMFEQAVHVPFMIKLPGRTPELVKQRVSHIDFLPTLMELLGRPTASQPVGKSLAPLMGGEKTTPEDIFIEWNPYKKREKRVKKGTTLASQPLVEQAIDESTRTVISDDGWKLSLRDKDLNELYDLNEDPLETRNVYYSGQHSEVIARCGDKIRRWQESTSDTVKLSFD